MNVRPRRGDMPYNKLLLPLLLELLLIVMGGSGPSRIFWFYLLLLFRVNKYIHRSVRPSLPPWSLLMILSLLSMIFRLNMEHSFVCSLAGTHFPQHEKLVRRCVGCTLLDKIRRVSDLNKFNYIRVLEVISKENYSNRKL
jgi:energy-coupling factor transporter transmembrane protein EcfT